MAKKSITDYTGAHADYYFAIGTDSMTGQHEETEKPGGIASRWMRSHSHDWIDYNGVAFFNRS